VGTTYAAHFAQPKIKGAEDLNLDNLPKVLEQRAYSVIHEFSVRLMNLAEESEKSPRRIEVVAGPWLVALKALDEMLSGQPVIVYVDAPYKREEYSRYYHVLETLVTYSYPSSLGTGRLPDKGTKDRPETEFFSRVEDVVNQAFIKLITEILKRGWDCAWSYADSGDANMVKVLSEVNKTTRCKVKSYATPYEHKPQGKSKDKEKKKTKKKVTEYLILFNL
jgi:hypothetical protein